MHSLQPQARHGWGSGEELHRPAPCWKERLMSSMTIWSCRMLYIIHIGGHFGGRVETAVWPGPPRADRRVQG